MNGSVPKSRRETRDLPYQPEAIIQRLRELLRKQYEIYREASLRAGLDHQAIRKILDGQRPNMTASILLWNHIGVTRMNSCNWRDSRYQNCLKFDSQAKRILQKVTTNYPKFRLIGERRGSYNIWDENI